MSSITSQMLADAERAHAANVAAAGASAKLVAALRVQLADAMPGKALGVKAAARLAGVHPRTIVRRARSGDLRHRRVGERWEFEPDAVIEAFRAA